jgi:tetratricopeptide (TPR) repeat protein
MKDDVLPREVLDRFASRTATAAERKAVVRHLLDGCGTCRSYLKRWLPIAGLPDVEDAFAGSPVDEYDEVFDRALLRVVTRLSPQGGHSPERLVTELEDHPPKRQETLVRNHPRYWTVEICSLLIERSHAARFRDGALMRQRAKLALLIAGQLDPASDPGAVFDCRTRAWMAFGNALRVSGDLPAAGAAFAEAESHLVKGTGAPPLRARFAGQLASLRFDQRRFEESLSLLGQAVEIWRQLHNSREVTLALIQQAMATGEGGRPKAAVHLLLEAGRLVDSAADPKLALIILHNVIRFHTYGGRSELALRLFVEARPLYRQERDPLIRVKELWVEGQIMSAQGHLEPAVRLLSAARAGLLAQGNRYEAGMVALDLAAVFAKLGRLDDMRALARETLQEMEAQGVRREGIAALILLIQAGTTEAALQLIRRVASVIRTSQRPIQAS